MAQKPVFCNKVTRIMPTLRSNLAQIKAAGAETPHFTKSVKMSSV